MICDDAQVRPSALASPPLPSPGSSSSDNQAQPPTNSICSPYDRAFKNLSPAARAGVGVGIMAWGTAGLYLSPVAEEKLGLTPTEEDKALLEKYTPKITPVERKTT